jgi:hypothetical protein
MQTVVTGLLFLFAFSNSMQRFDTGEPATPLESAIDAAGDLFAFPIVTAARLLPPQSFPGLWGWLPFILNGLLWGSLVVLVLEYRQRRGAAGS